MEEKNELNDIILNRGGSGSNSKKLLLAVAALTLILIIVLVIMNSLKSETNAQPPVAIAPPVPTAPTEVIDDPLFEPIEVIQEGNNTSNGEDLGKIAQKLKEESFDSSAVQNKPTPTAQVPQVVSAPTVSKVQPITPKPEPVKENPSVQKNPVINTPTIKNIKPVVENTESKKTAITPKKIVTTPKSNEKTVPKPVESAKAVENQVQSAEKATDSQDTYYIQVGSFTGNAKQELFDRISASGLKYITRPNGNATKVLIGPFQSDKAARDVVGSVRKNIEASAYIIKG